ncbi:hypothetical protein HK100_011445 [Physocladia obscura]|uniref:Uncharacterized protein n=1 Tax=Physocladia obscura TaxID=109957 RepID=A0AAD5T2P4_9FUNG|nr:hypothetical protein HK100_011445 [Physocladia obscura]
MPLAPRASQAITDSFNSPDVTSSSAPKENLPFILIESDDDFENVPQFIRQPTATMKRKRNETNFDEMQGQSAVSERLICSRGKCVEGNTKSDGTVVTFNELDSNGNHEHVVIHACEIAVLFTNQSNLMREDILYFIDQLAAKARAKDKKAGYDINMTALESNQMFRDLWAQHNGNCTCCNVELLSLGGGAAQISKQKNKPGLPYHHPHQELDWLCVACNRLRDEFSAREVLNVFTKIQAAAQKTPVPRQPTPTEITRIKAMRKDNYAKEDREIVKTIERNNWSLSPTAETTATSDELIAIARGAGCIGIHSEYILRILLHVAVDQIK